ncbi:MAG: hypothetical protein GC160_19725 [Acidobacteria bacterium]|nr:hypothetical protein [Acidobacteriota bacterium]
MQGLTGGEASPRYVALREIRGEEELADLSPAALVEKLVVADGSAPLDALSLSDQDRLLEEVYRNLYGAEVGCHAVCVACGKAFEMSFSLDDWIRSLVADDDPGVRSVGDGTFDLPQQDGLERVRFRLPTEVDVARAAAGDEAEAARALRSLCVLEGDSEDPRLDAAMARVGPLLDDEIEAECAHCGASQTVAFRLADYLLASLRRERPLVLREVHCLARSYHWSRPDILSMPRSFRREHVRLVLAETEQGDRSWL